MTDDQVMHFLMHVSSYVAQLHERTRLATTQPSNAGPRFGDDSIPAEPEDFARWMGWRGEAEQEREIRNVREKS